MAVTIVLVVLAIVCGEGCMVVRGEMEIAKRDKEEELGGGNGRILGLASCCTRRTNIGGR